MRRFACLVCVAVWTGWSLPVSSASAELVEGTLQTTETVTNWLGFESDFNPTWNGETEFVRWVPFSPTVPSLGYWSSGTMMTMGTMSIRDSWRSGYWTTQWTVNKISSSRSVQTSTTAKVQGNSEEFQATNGHTKDEDATLADFARVMTTNGHLLTQGSAIAAQTSAIGERALDVTGRVFATTLALDEAKDGSADANASSIFSAAYELSQDTPYVLSLNLASIGETDLVFTVEDYDLGNVILSYSPASRESLQIEQTGTLATGRYKFSLRCEATASANTEGLHDPGGMADYDVSLAFAAKQYDVWVGETYNLAGCTVIDANSLSQDNSGVLVDDGSTFLLQYAPDGTCSVVPLASAVPEPGSAALLIAAAGTLVLLRRRSAVGNRQTA